MTQQEELRAALESGDPKQLIGAMAGAADETWSVTFTHPIPEFAWTGSWYRFGATVWAVGALDFYPCRYASAKSASEAVDAAVATATEMFGDLVTGSGGQLQHPIVTHTHGDERESTVDSEPITAPSVWDTITV